MAIETVQVRSGEPFEITLSEPVTGGFRWRVSNIPPEVTLLDEHYAPPDPGPLGSPGSRILRARAQAAGRYRLEFVLESATDPRPAREHRVEVLVA